MAKNAYRPAASGLASAGVGKYQDKVDVANSGKGASPERTHQWLKEQRHIHMLKKKRMRARRPGQVVLRPEQHTSDYLDSLTQICGRETIDRWHGRGIAAKPTT